MVLGVELKPTKHATDWDIISFPETDLSPSHKEPTAQVPGRVGGTFGTECSSIQIPVVPSVLVEVLGCRQ